MAPDAAPAEASDPLVGQVLDRYRVIEKLGEGGMGTVYAVEHVMLQKRMAMKLLRADLSRNQELVTRFQNEAIAASRIGQENIVAVTDFGRSPDGLVYFIMEELHGASLAAVLRAERSLEIGRSVAIAAQICRALHAAHSVGIIHRDLKPENVVLVTREGHQEFVKVLDFGISKMVEQRSAKGGEDRLTQMGMIVGTPEYMSPEQAAGKTVDQRSDVYSLGVMLFEMIIGQLPFQAENPLQVLMKHQTEIAPTFESIRPGFPVSPELEAMVRRALAKMPEERQQSMAECLADLQSCAEKEGFTQPALRLPNSSPSRPPFIATPRPNWEAPTALTPAPPGSAAAGTTAVAAPLSDADFDLLAAKPRRTGLWLVLGALLLGAAVLFFALGRHGGVAEPPLTVTPEPAAPAPAQAPLPLPPTPAPLAALPEPAAPVPAQPTPEAKPAAAPQDKPVRHAPRAGAPPSGAAPAKPAAAEQPDPYQKMDDLKQAY